MKWISVEDRLPDSDNFLGTDGKVVFAAYYCDLDKPGRYRVGGWENCYDCGGISCVSLNESSANIKKITHWMPLPELPNCPKGHIY